MVQYSGILPRIFFVVGVQQIQLRTEGRENGDLGAVAAKSGIPLNLQMSETRILIRLLQMYFNFGILRGRYATVTVPQTICLEGFKKTMNVLGQVS
jgi:hypothetical protein